jgi:hypothetical protein
MKHSYDIQTISGRRAVRQFANVRQSNMPIQVVPGAVAPHFAGESYYFTTLSGKTIIQHPAAYRWPMWYHASTRRVVVGSEWLAIADSVVLAVAA